METAEQILKKNESRVESSTKENFDHLRLSSLLYQFSTYGFHTTLSYYKSLGYQLDVIYKDEDERELIHAILSYYNMSSFEIKYYTAPTDEFRFLTITSKK